ncbi:uncharacterized protein LOC119083605 isoform X2 [Bradysia coprophila]|uniref:uncharacterized protein LOC119083605 isoform X2 n=1 Tax=Bradysia coprophila TaxID=38358 RepID=UPI00187D92BD|nr:uncharacterized protein LOC119083605 isoform X2 [Bradysia coprophila]
MRLVCIFWLCFVINSTYGRSIGYNSTIESEPISATWTDFQIRHVVSSDQGSEANWNAYFRRQLPSQYGIKSVNSFIVNSAGVISGNFPSGVPQYTGGSASNLYWSSTRQHIFVLTLSGSPGQPHPNYNVYDCGQKYYVAGLDMVTRLPVHYQGHSTTQGPRIDQITAGCTKVMANDLLCQLGETIDGRRTECISVIVSGTLLGLVIVAFLLVAVLLSKRGVIGNNTSTNEHSPLIGSDGPSYGNPQIT